jgi:P27 family predicted phage terminase small subunit
MKPGPPRLPTKVLQMRGSQHRKRPDEPTAPPLRSRAPAWLDADGKKLWAALLKRFDGVGIVTELDHEALARYCDMLATWRKMAAWRHKHGEVYPVRGVDNQVIGAAIWPQIGLYLKLAEQLCKMEQQFGLTPASRASLVKVQETPPHGNSDEAQNKARFFTLG